MGPAPRGELIQRSRTQLQEKVKAKKSNTKVNKNPILRAMTNASEIENIEIFDMEKVNASPQHFVDSPLKKKQIVPRASTFLRKV